MKIFVIAYACEPYRQSESGLGWNIAGEIARRHEVTVLARANNREKIESFIAEHPEVPQARIRFLYHDIRGVKRILKKKIPLGDQIYFSAWLKSAADKYKDSFKDYDIVHQLTFSPFFVKPWGARYTNRYVWGPIGGGGGPEARFPKGFKTKGLSNRITEWLYRAISWAVYSPFAREFAKLRKQVAAVTFKAKAFSVGFPIDEGQLSAIVQETGYGGEIPSREYKKGVHSLKVVAVGRMIPHKGFEYAIKGFNKFIENGGQGEFHIFGDGPLREELEALGGNVIFHGNVKNTEVHAALDSSDIFLHGSFIEAAAWSILEAMIHGVPVVCQDRSGMADMVTADCGTRVPVKDEQSLIDEFAAALKKYYEGPSLIERHGRAGQDRVKNVYTWTKSGDLIDEVYRKVTGGVE